MPASEMDDVFYFNLEGRVCTGREQSNFKYNRHFGWSVPRSSREEANWELNLDAWGGVGQVSSWRKGLPTGNSTD